MSKQLTILYSNTLVKIHIYRENCQFYCLGNFLFWSVCLTVSVSVVATLEMVEGVYDVLQPVHVVPVNVPVSEVAITLVLYVPHVLAHDVTGDVLALEDALLQHGHLEFAQDLGERGKII